MSFRVEDVKLLQSNVITVNPAPNEVYCELDSLRQEFRPNHGDVSQKGAEALSVASVDVDTGKAVSHLASVVKRDDLQVVTFVAVLHLLE